MFIRHLRSFTTHDSLSPERFIDGNGGFKKPQELIPFGLGKRQCLGENLARMELFLFLSNLFNQFKVSNFSTMEIQTTIIL